MLPLRPARPVAALLLAACAHAAAPAPAPQTAPAAQPDSGRALITDPAEAFVPKHMLFRVTGGDGGATMYILGSVHLLSADAATLPPVVDSAFDRAALVAFETSLDTLQMRALEMLSRAMLPAGTTLDDVLDPETYRALTATLPAYGIDITKITHYKPWMVSLLLTQSTMARAKFQPQYGVDVQINARAKAAGKRVMGLEPVDLQLRLFDDLRPADVELMLREQMVSPDSAVRSLVSIKDAWVTGDTAAVNRALNENVQKSPTLFATMVSNRNRDWLPRLVAMLEGSDDVLVVVGAAHLVGDKGVLALLRQKGYRIQQL